MIQRSPAVHSCHKVSAIVISMLLCGLSVNLGTRNAVWVQSFAIRTHTCARPWTASSGVRGVQSRTAGTVSSASPSSLTVRSSHFPSIRQQPQRFGTVFPMTKASSSSSSSASSDAAYGVDMDQNALMESDMLVAVDENDLLIPQAVLSKKQGHTFTEETPRATLHRAFSLFLFNKDNKLLLTQRAASKITFPDVWTNTLCSHPLYDMVPNEADVTPDAYPDFPGIKHAAVRKGLHELGLSAADLPMEHMQFITRFHYWAADTVTYGKQTPWGEHEVDYILFLKTNRDTVPVQPQPDEVADYKYVSIDELQEMRRDPTLLWSPWFLGILERGGWDWWADLNGALEGKYTNTKVTYFDPPESHVGHHNLASHTRHTGVLSPPSEAAAAAAAAAATHTL